MEDPLIMGRHREEDGAGARAATDVAEVRSPNVYQSGESRYFIGRTGIFRVPAGRNCLVLLDNPQMSKRTVVLIVITLTSNRGRRAVFTLDASAPSPLTTSRKVANIHRGDRNEPVARIRYGTAVDLDGADGVDAFERLLVGKETLNTEQEGTFMFDPGHSIGVRFPAIEVDDELDVAWGWFEEEIHW